MLFGWLIKMLLKLKQIGDVCTLDDINAIVYLLKQKVRNNGSANKKKYTGSTPRFN